MGLLQTGASLRTYCDTARQGEWLAVDTEFNRTTTYFAELCLIQLNSPTAGIAAVDPLSLLPQDMQPLWDLLRQESVLKILHAARGDYEIFWHGAGFLPTPLFDTQIAAAALGYGEQVGYDKLVKSVTGKQIDKSSRFTDWTRRPLSADQLAYALDDVRYLPDVHHFLKEKLAEKGRTEWLAEELAVMLAPETYIPEPLEAWRKIRTRGGSPAFIGRVRVLSAWREREAMHRNQNRTRVLRDEMLLKVAAEPPKNSTDFARQLSIKDMAMAESLFSSLSAAEPVRLPPVPEWATGSNAVAELLRLLLRIRCQQEGIAEKLVAGSEDLDKLAYYEADADVPCLKGWRRDIYGDDALKLLAGKLSLTYDNQAKQVVFASVKTDSET